MNSRRLWLADLVRTSHRSNCTPRRIVAPERLESRNAPGALLPLLSSPLEGDTHSPEELEHDAAENRQVIYVYQAEYSNRPESTFDFSFERAANSFFGQQYFNQQPNAASPRIEIAQPRIPYETAVLDKAFEMLSEGGIGESEELPPPLIQPVIMDPASPHNRPDLQPVPISPPAYTGTGSPPTAASSPSGTIQIDVSSPLTPPQEVVPPLVLPPNVTAPEQQPAEIPPPVIQPVIMDPDSDHNIPTSVPGEIDHRIIQPVIMDPASEHNTPSSASFEQ